MNAFTMANGSCLRKLHAYRKLRPFNYTKYIWYPVTLNTDLFVYGWNKWYCLLSTELASSFSAPTRPRKKGWYPLFAHVLNFLGKSWTTVSYPYNCDVELLIGLHNFPGSNKGLDWVVFFALQKLGDPGMHLKPKQVASISAICKGKDVFIWLPPGFGKSVCYDTTTFVIEMRTFVMDCKLGRVDSESGEV